LALKKSNYHISILEKTNKLLAKVKISGGGRCNVTHRCFENTELVKNYPRGSKELLQVFSKFNVQHTIDWFKTQGVVLKTEEDGRMFPHSNSSETIVNCFLNLAQQLNIDVITQCEVLDIKKEGELFHLNTTKENFQANTIICAIGGHNKTQAYQTLKNLGHTIHNPVPSLFTLNLPNEPIKKELQGISVQLAEIKVVNSKLNYSGPILITHWGLSGPAVLKLSAFAAIDFFNMNYQANVAVNWAHPLKVHEIETQLKQLQKDKHKALPHSKPLLNLPKRLWEYLCMQAEINNKKPWAEISHKNLKQLAEKIGNNQFKMEGKTTFKDEFVTSGGVDLKEIDFKTMQSKLIPGLFFCGEVLNIDGLTGGFNFQNAWSTAWICADSC
jgi:predicted Rossmann fold flavoprotein